MDLEFYQDFRNLLLSFKELKTLSDYQKFLKKLKEKNQTNTIDLYEKEITGANALQTSLLEIAFETLSYHALIDFINIYFDNEEKRTKLKATFLQEDKPETLFEIEDIEDIEEQPNEILLYSASRKNPEYRVRELTVDIGDFAPGKRIIEDHREYEYREVRRCFKDIYDAITSPNDIEIKDYFSLREKIKNLDLTRIEFEKSQRQELNFSHHQNSRKTFQELAKKYLDIPSFTALIYSLYDSKETDKQIKQKKHYLQEKLFKAATQNNGDEDNIKKIRNLIGSGANVNAQDKDGNTALHLAVYNKNKRTIKTLQDIEAIRILIDSGVDVNAKNQDGNTALHLAVYNNDIDTIKTLIADGVDVNAKNQDGNTALHLAVYNNDIDTIKTLIADGVDVNAKNQDGNTALHLVAHYQNIEAIRILIDSGVDVNAHYQDIEAISKILIDAGASNEIQNNNDHTPVRLAVITGQRSLAAKMNQALGDKALNYSGQQGLSLN